MDPTKYFAIQARKQKSAICFEDLDAEPHALEDFANTA